MKLAIAAVGVGYELTDGEVAGLPTMAATVIDDLVIFKGSLMDQTNRFGWQWRAAWFRDIAQALSE